MYKVSRRLYETGMWNLRGSIALGISLSIISATDR